LHVANVNCAVKCSILATDRERDSETDRERDRDSDSERDAAVELQQQ